jgi:hypothetical protein
MCWSEGHEAAEGVRLWLTPLLIKRSRLSSRGWAAFRLVRGWMVGLGGLEPPTSSLSAKYRDRCADGCFRRSHSTVGAEVKCSNDLQLSALPTRPERTDIALITADSVTRLRSFTAIYLHIHLHHATSASLSHLHQHFLTNLTHSRSPFLRLIALPSYHPNPRHDSPPVNAGPQRRYAPSP